MNIKGTLLLSRKEGENIIIESGKEKIIINLVEATKGRAKIRVCASQSVKIYREEIYCLASENPDLFRVGDE